MKIIVEGNRDRIRRVIRFTCSACGCVWEADKSEYTYSYDQRDGEYSNMKCPCCGSTTYGAYK